MVPVSSGLACLSLPSVPRGTRGRRRGFTLLEVLLVLALLGLLASVLIAGASGLLNDKPRSADEVFWAAVQEARKMALRSEREISLRFVEDKDRGKAFVVSSAESTRIFAVPSPGDLEVSFLSQQKGGTLIMVAGTVLETKKIEAVVFYPDGTCSPFRVQFFRNGATHVTSVDPWTCAPMLTAKDANSTGNPS